MNNKKQIINIVNFIRAEKGREAEEGSPYVNYLETTLSEVELVEKYELAATYLFQYDALIDPRYTEPFMALDNERVELGLWFEIPMELCLDAGLKWTGEYRWDYHCHCNCPIGYTKKERYLLVDQAFEKFKSVFGYYPRTVGAWLFDAATLRYMSEKYDIDAFCNCKEQFGTDGYTLWGGYYGQAYYPSKINQFLPAKSEDTQINVPMFRMLGCDPIYQYDSGLDLTKDSYRQDVISLEPVYPESGGSPRWVDWYLRQNFNGECLSFGYAQAGQENAFGWDRIKAGLRDQLPKFKRLAREGRLTVETMGASGRWYKSQYSTTPASAISCHGAYDDDEKDTVWYCTKKYRINLYGKSGNFRIRDIHVFDENLPCPYEDAVCTENSCTFEALPIMDGNAYSGNGILAGIFFKNADGEDIKYDEMTFSDLGGGEAEVDFGETRFHLFENGFEIKRSGSFCAEFKAGKTSRRFPKININSQKREVKFTYQQVDYSANVEIGNISDDGFITSDNGIIKIIF